MAIKQKQSGVTLIEMIIVIAIFSVVSSILLFNYSDFSTNVSIRNLSQEVALSVRKAQTYATSVHGVGSSVQSFPSYGIVFSTSTPSLTYDPNPKQFIVFADIAADISSQPSKKYESNNTCGNPGIGNECLESISINTSDIVEGFQINGDTALRSGTLAITFRRPTADASFCYISSGSTCDSSPISYVKIVLKSAKGLEKKVTIWNTGQISAE